jgi:hypothetical protein
MAIADFKRNGFRTVALFDEINETVVAQWIDSIFAITVPLYGSVYNIKTYFLLIASYQPGTCCILVTLFSIIRSQIAQGKRQEMLLRYML